MATNPMHQFSVHRIGPEIKIAGVDLSFTNASLFMVISALTICIFLLFGTKEKKLIPEINVAQALEMINNETIVSGMIPKINTCIDAVNNGVKGVVIIDGRRPHSILFELFSDKGSGTLIRK